MSDIKKENLVSILILTYNQLQFTRQCIKSLLESTSIVKTPFEVLVFDNGSTDGTVEYLQGLESSKVIRVIYSRENVGFPKGNNELAKIAKGNYLCLCNNDIVFTEGWLEKLLRGIRSDTHLAAVGPYSNNSSGLQMSPMKCTYNNNNELVAFAKRYGQADRYVDFLVFFCCLIKRNIWDELGGLDEDFSPGNFEDNLFCWQVAAKDLKLKIIGDCFIHHFGSKSWQEENKKKANAYRDIICRNQKMFLRKIKRYKTIGLCMIVSDREKPEDFKKCLDNIAGWVDEINIVFNYKRFPNRWRLKKLLKTLPFQPVETNTLHPKWKYEYIKFTDFSKMRNLSLDMAWDCHALVGNEEVLSAPTRDKEGNLKLQKLTNVGVSMGEPKTDYILWLDVDDFMVNPMGMRDLMLSNPDIDVFKFRITSMTEVKTQETIVHNRLFKNKYEYKFRNKCHEDVSFSMLKHKATMVMTNLVIQHKGYVNKKSWMAKNKRNYALLLQDIKENPHSLTYYGIVNCLMIFGGKENLEQGIRYIDECFEKCGLKPEDPLTPKMWVLRGAICMDAKQDLAAKQSFHKAFDEWKHPEAAVNLAEIYMREHKYDKAIEILNVIYQMKEFKMSNISFDPVHVELLMLQKLGDCYFLKATKEKSKEAKVKLWIKAEKHYREHLSIRKFDLHTADRLSLILRNTGRTNEANLITVAQVNKHPDYYVGWNNLATGELLAGRHITAKLFFEECLRWKPDYKEAKHNLKQINQMLRGKKK